MKLVVRGSLAMAALVASVVLPAVSLGSCGGGGAAQGATSSSSAGGAPSSASGTGNGGSTGAILVGSGGGSTATCGGPPASDAGDDGPTGCEGIEGGVGFAAVAPLFSGCAGETCHESPWTQPELVDIVAYECCDGRFLVAPGDPNHSYLVDKLEGTMLCQGHRMPLSGPPYFTAEQIATVRAWICSGAPAD
jgi:hypothetical protein